MAKVKVSNQLQNEVTSLKLKAHYLNKKAQEEIMGFILILVLIIVIGMFFIFMMKPKVTQTQQSMQVENLLTAIKHVNSACNREMQDVIIMCSREETCGDLDACNYLKTELKIIIDTAIDKAGMGNVVAYNLNITGIGINIVEGNVTGTSMSAISPIQQDLEMQLKFYYP